MATAQHGLAYLDLAGNRVLWSPEDHQRSAILLVGSHFHNAVSMAALVISALCLLLFIILIVLFTILIVTTWTDGKKAFPRKRIWGAMFFLICFFTLDIANRVFHELEATIPSLYLIIDVFMGSLISLADVLVIWYLLQQSLLSEVSAPATVAMGIAAFMYAIIAFATRGTQIWGLVAQVSPPSHDSGDKVTKKALQIFQDLASASSGMLLLFAIGLFFAAIAFIRNQRKSLMPSKQLSIAAGILGTAFLIRSTVDFVFGLLYAQYYHIDSPAVQLISVGFYGLSSVAMFASIIRMVTCSQTTSDAQGAITGQYTTASGRVGWPQEKPQVKVRTDAYQTSYGISPYP